MLFINLAITAASCAFFFVVTNLEIANYNILYLVSLPWQWHTAVDISEAISIGPDTADTHVRINLVSLSSNITTETAEILLSSSITRRYQQFVIRVTMPLL